jgi:hypothetical protein
MTGHSYDQSNLWARADGGWQLVTLPPTATQVGAEQSHSGEGLELQLLDTPGSSQGC